MFLDLIIIHCYNMLSCNKNTKYYLISKYFKTMLKSEIKEVALKITSHSRFFPTPITPPILVVNVYKEGIQSNI